MIVILDASTLINLVNGEILSDVTALPGLSFQVSAVVRAESKTVADALEAAVATGALAWVDDSKIAASQFAQAKSQWLLDDGETECILAAEAIGCVVATDDLAARKVVLAHLGRARLSGSIGLLRQAILAGSLTPDRAHRAYRLMVDRGGFLPELAVTAFKPPF